MTKFRWQVVRLAVAAFLCLSVLNAWQNAPAPQQPVPPSPPRHQFFAGTVAELDATHIKVTRTLVGRPTESRSFAIVPTTKMNKAAVKLHSRVTVRFKRQPDGDIALEIQPRPVLPRTPKP